MISSILKVLFIMVILSVNTIVQAKTLTNLVTPVSYFINHRIQFNAIEDNFKKYNHIGIVGTSGMGKTQLARMYAYENKENYNIIWFFDCTLDINEQFAKLAKEINLAFNNHIIEDQSLAKKEVLHYLQSKKDWLLVFDNLKINENTKIQDLIDWEHNGNIIFCSQDSSKLNYITEVTKLKKQDAIELVSLILKEKKLDTINFLVEEFQGHPILLVQGAQILNNIKGLDYEKYKKMIRESNNKIRLNIELCMKELTLSSSALLKKIALINNNKFSKSFLKMVTDNKETIDDDIYQLSKYILISNIDSHQDNPIFEMHDIIAKTIQDINTVSENNKNLDEIIFNVLVKAFPTGVVQKQDTRVSPTFNENLQIILENTKKFHVEIFKDAKLREEILLSGLNNRKYDLSAKMVEWFEQKEKNDTFKVNKMNDHERYVYASYLNAIGGYNNFALSNPVRAIDYFTRAKEIMLGVNGYESIKFNIIYQILRTQLDLGQIDNAEQTLEEILKIYELGIKNKTIEPFDNSFLYVAKTRLLMAQAKYKEALTQVNNAINVFKEAGIKDTNVLLESSCQMKVEALNSLNKYSEAYSLAQWLYETYKPNLYPDHEIFANIHTKMAVSQYGLGKYQKGLEEANKAIKMFIKVRKLDEQELQFARDIQLAKALMIKADCLSALDRIEESLNIYEKAEAIHNNVYIENLNTSNSLKNLLFEATKTACKKPSKQNEFWFKHFYSRLRSIFGIDITQVKEIEKTCNPEIYKTY